MMQPPPSSPPAARRAMGRAGGLGSTLAFCLLLLAGCSYSQSRREHVLAGVQDLLRRSEYEGALSALRGSKARSDQTSRGDSAYSGIWLEQDRVAYWMEEGMLALLAGRHEESITALHRAQQRITELYTQSRRKILASTLNTDIVRDYAGHLHERRLVDTLLILNYLLLGEPEAARVEAARSDGLAAIKPGRHAEASPPDPFSRWISGLAHEIVGEWDDARICYQQAREAYRGYHDMSILEATPTWLEQDITRIARSGETEPGTTVTSMPREAGELFIFHFNGQGPSLEEGHLECQSIGFEPEEFGAVDTWRPLEVIHRYWFAVVRGHEPWEYLVRDYQPDPDHPGDSRRKWRCGKTSSRFGSGPNKVVVLVPRMVTRTPKTAHAVIFAGDERAVTQTVHPLAQIALKNFESTRHRVHVRAAIRMSTRFRYQGSGAGWIADDRRHWTTLPHRIDVARLSLPPGKHEVTVRLRKGASALKLGTVVVGPGKRIFRVLHTR